MNTEVPGPGSRKVRSSLRMSRFDSARPSSPIGIPDEGVALEGIDFVADEAHVAHLGRSVKGAPRDSGLLHAKGSTNIELCL